MKKRVLAVLLSVIMGITAIPSIFIEATEIENKNEKSDVQVHNEDDFVIDENGVLTSYNGSDTEVVIPEGVTSIGEYVFRNCNNLISVVFPESLISIGVAAFYGCSSLVNITIPKGVTSIGSSAFAGCSSLTSFMIPEGITSIGFRTFDGCSSLTNIIIPKGVTSIGSSAFYDCSSLENVIIPEGITSIGSSAFYGCSSLTSIIIPKGVTSVGSSAFYNCSSLTDIVIPEGIASIEQSVFAGCNSLKNIVVPKGVTSIGSSAFDNCSSLTDIVIQEGVISIGDNAFKECSSLTSIIIPKGVTSIGNCAFIDCSSLENIEISEEVTYIGYSVFLGCSNLTNIVIPKEITSIEYGTFAGCNSLKNVVIPENVVRIGGSAFQGCNSLTDIIIPERVTSIGDSAFDDCSSLTNITIPKGITSIGSYAFCGCSSLTNIIIPEEVTSIGSYAFCGCSSLTNVILPKGITTIEEYVFAGCSSLTNIIIPEGVTNIESRAFEECSSLTNIILPKSVINIGSSAFQDCSNLINITIPERITNIWGYTFWNCNSLTSITIPKAVTYIDESAFWECHNLIIYCIEDSYAHSFAKTYNIPYELIEDIKQEETEQESETVKKQSQNDIQVYVMNPLGDIEPYIKGANIIVEDFGSAITDVNGYARIENTLTEQPLVNSKVSITKEGYREYYFYRDIYNKDAELFWDTNNISVFLKKLNESDKTNPYVSTLMCQTLVRGVYDIMQSSVTYDTEETEETVTMQVNAVWNGKTPSSYVLYQENGKSYTSTDGKFTLSLPNAFDTNEKIYIKLIATDGTEVAEETCLKIKKRVQSSISDSESNGGLEIINTDSTGMIGEDVPFLSGQELKIELKNVSVEYTIQDNKVRVMFGKKELGKDNSFDSKEWEEWKSICDKVAENPNLFKMFETMDKIPIKSIPMKCALNANAESYVCGYAEGTINNKGDIIVEGGIIIEATMKVGMYAPYMIGGILPAYVEIFMGMDGKAGGGLAYNLTQNKLDNLNTMLNFKPYVGAANGFGIMAVAEIKPGGQGVLPIEVNLETGKETEYKVELNAEFFVKAKLLCFEYTLEFKPKPIQLLPKQESQDLSVANYSQLSLNDFTLSECSHLSEESLWLGDTAIQPFSLETTETNLVERTLKTNINPDAQIQLIDTGTTKMILWTESDANREIINNSKLVYSIYNRQTDTWSTPTAVVDDGTADYAPTVVTDGEKIYVAWQNISKTFTNDATLSEVAKASTIAMSIWSEQTGFSKQLTISKENTMAVTPKIALNKEGIPYVAYIENTNNDLLLTSGTNNILYSVIKENNVVHNTFVENAGLVMALDTTYTNGYEVSYTLDTDNDLATLEDREIITNDKSELSTKNEVMDSNAIYIKNGNKTLRFWYQNNSIHMSDEAGMETVIYEDETGTLTDDFHVVSGTEGKLAVIWTATDEENNNQIEGILYNSEDGSWTKSVQISDTDAHVYNPQGIFTEDGKLQFLYKKTGTQTDLCVLMVTPSVDLAVDGVYCDETTFAPGSVATFSVKITNNGTKKADTYTVNIDGTKSTFTQALEPSESTVVEAIYMVPADFDYRTLNITVEAENDTDITDNTCSYEVGYTEVVVNVNDSKYEFGQLVEVRVANESCIDTTAVLEVRKDSRDGELLKTIDLGTLTKGELTTATYLWNEETENYSEDAEALYFNVVSEKAEKYTNNNYDFVATPTKESDVEESFVLGDLNGDGAVKINDMLTMLHGISGSQILNEKQQLAADIDKDSKVTVRDMLRVMHYISGASSTL